MVAELRSVLITGCSSGIGAAACEGLRARGYRVIATARREQDVARLAQAGFDALRLDLADPASIERGVSQVLEMTQGKLFGLFNNAAYGQPGAVEDLTREMLQAQFETNFFGTQELTNGIIPVMRAQGFGRIVYNSSILGLAAFPYRGAYNASKFALEGLVDTLRLELRGSGISVVLIEPGPIESRFRENAYAVYVRNLQGRPSVHAQSYVAMERRLRAKAAVAPFTLPPDAVVKRLVHALEARHPKPRYFVTVPTYLFAILRRLLPTRWLDRVLLMASGGGRH